MIERLRKHEEVILYGNIHSISADENQLASDFLRSEFEMESLEYPPEFPDFNPEAAIWGAQTIYIAAQLILYRENKIEDAQQLLPAYPLPITSDSILSADLCLRFLPDLVHQLLLIDSADPLIGILESILQQWHYSGIRYSRLVLDQLDFSSVTTNLSMFQLYCWRIIEQKKTILAEYPIFNEAISAQFGIYSPEFWNTFKRITSPLPA